MRTKLGKRLERLAGTCPRRECPYCKYKFERVSRYCNMCGRPVRGKEGGKRQWKAANGMPAPK